MINIKEVESEQLDSAYILVVVQSMASWAKQAGSTELRVCGDRPTLPSVLMTSPSFRGETVNVAGEIHILSLSRSGYLETVGRESEGHVDPHTQLEALPTQREECSDTSTRQWWTSYMLHR